MAGAIEGGRFSSVPQGKLRCEELGKGKLTVSPTNSQATGTELKLLPAHLKYAFLEKK